MRWFTRPKVDPSIKQLASSLPYGSQETYGPPEVVPMPNMPDLLREEGIQVGEQVKAPVYNTRKYFKPGGLVEPGVTHYGKTKGKTKFEATLSEADYKINETYTPQRNLLRNPNNLTNIFLQNVDEH